MSIESGYLQSVRKQFLYYKTLAEKAMEQLDEPQLFEVSNSNTNSIAIIVKHMSGNMLSRWTDIFTSDGEKEWRNRDAEFEDSIHSRQQLLEVWQLGWDRFLNTLNSLTPEQLSTIIYIRNEGHTVVDAINRQLAHYSYHIGQIVFYAKLLSTAEWNTLSIAKNRSADYNKNKFTKEKTIRHFTDDEPGQPQ